MATYQEIQQHLKALADQKAELEQTALQMKEAATAEMAENVLKYITENGFEVKEVLHRIQAMTSRPVTTYLNPDNPEEKYSKGPLPGWFKAKMKEAGLDPESKAEVKQFKETLPKKA